MERFLEWGVGAFAETEFNIKLIVDGLKLIVGMQDISLQLKELTNVDFERDSAETESERSSLRSLLTQFIENKMRSCSMED